FGRFLTADPITSSPLTTQGNNRYAYVDNDPINLTDPSGFAPSGGFFDGWPSPYTEIVTGAYTAAWVGLATYAVIDALRGASAGATAGGAAVATPTTSTLSAEFVVVGKNVGKAPGGAASIGLGIGSGIQILDAANLPLPKPAVPARSPTPGQAPTGNAKAQSLGRVGPARGYPTAWKAAQAALERYNPESILSKDPTNVLDYGDEYGGLIYEFGGRYHYTEAVVSEPQGTVHPWKAMKYVPEKARSRIVGDYHTHGGPNAIVDGEDFSGFHHGIGSSSKTLSGLG